MPGSVMWFDGPLSVRRPATGRHLPLLRLSFTVRDEWFAGRWCHRATSSWYNGTIDPVPVGAGAAACGNK
jgi:hypothetical protein